MTDQAAASPPALHLLGRFNDLYTGAERELLDLRRLIAGRSLVTLWSDMPVHAAYATERVTFIQPFARQFPVNGTLLIGGVHLQPGIWLKHTRFERIILFHNLANQLQLFAIIARIREFTGLEPEIVFVSDLLRRTAALPGKVIPSLIDLASFLQVAGERLERFPVESLQARPFTVGRASRDFLEKHHPQDLALYRMLASRGVRVRIMGGRCLAPGLGDVEGIELLPAGAESMADFYRSLDSVFYRTGMFVEAYGRVVLEAMAAGLPVVAHDVGGYTEVIEHGVSGFLIRTQEEAYDTLMALKNSAGLRRQIGAAASREAVRVHGPMATQGYLDFYARGAAVTRVVKGP